MRGFINVALSFFIGAIALSLFSTIQKMAVGFPIVLKGYLVPVLAGGSFGLVIGIWQLRLKKNQEKTERLNLVLRTIRNVNQLLVNEKDRSRLLQGICDNLIDNRGYYNAWIALFDEFGGLMATVEAGLGKEFLPMVERFKRGKLTHCAQKALMQSEVVLTKDPFYNCTDCPLSEKYAGRGAMTLRLEHGGKVYGLLTVSIPAEIIFDEEEQGLFQEIAGDIAFGLYQMYLEEEQRKAEKMLREIEKNFRDLAENSLIGIIIIQDDQVVYRNPEQDRIAGLLAEQSEPLTFKNIYPDDVEKVKQGYQKIISGEKLRVDMDFRFYPLDKIGSKPDLKWVYCRVNLFEYQGKEAILVNMMDVTRARELENIIRIKDKMNSLGHVATGIAHEIRNPLSGINIYLNTLEKIYDREENFEKVLEILGELQSASNKIESVVRGVMNFSKPSGPKLVLTNINKPVKEAIKLSSVTLRKSGIKVEKALYEDLPLCHTDPNLIEQVILNLITNAVEAMKNKEGTKRIKITSSMENDLILVGVSDSGPGVPLDLKDKIFDPFYTTKNGNTGIGLSLNLRIITDLGGSLDVSTNKWGGAEFRFEIPIAKN